MSAKNMFWVGVACIIASVVLISFSLLRLASLRPVKTNERSIISDNQGTINTVGIYQNDDFVFDSTTVKTDIDTPDTLLLFREAADSIAVLMSIDTLGVFILYDRTGTPLRAKFKNDRWEVQSDLPIRILLKDGYLESRGDSIEAGFNYIETAKDFNDLVGKVRQKQTKRENWFVGSPLTQEQADYLTGTKKELTDSVTLRYRTKAIIFGSEKSGGDPSISILNYSPKDRSESDVAICEFERRLIDSYRKRGFKVIADWSYVRQCSVMVHWSKTDGDSSIVYYTSNPDNKTQGLKFGDDVLDTALVKKKN